ncbi:unnamed protein product [Prorocentrum cordatum]|uniref:Uncharacterized protein n=1 Tax=Prorocentrum cordatum TaxID=2364126 RepID=A0ABN9UZ35_9DINO|nr:unnamed protein product [Polarella glacialis]
MTPCEEMAPVRALNDTTLVVFQGAVSSMFSIAAPGCLISLRLSCCAFDFIRTSPERGLAHLQRRMWASSDALLREGDGGFGALCLECFVCQAIADMDHGV